MRRLPFLIVALALADAAVLAALPRLLWHVAGGARPLHAPVRAGDEAVVVADAAGTLRRLDRVSGLELGRTTLDPPPRQLLGTPGALIALGELGSVRWLDPSGVPVDSLALPAPASAPALAAEGKLVVPLSDGVVVAIDLVRRVVAWRRTCPGVVRHKPGAAPGQVALLTDGGRLLVLRLLDGGEIAAATLPGEPAQPPAIFAGLVVVPLEARPLEGIDGRSGRRRFRAEIGRGASAPPLADLEQVVIPTLANQLLALKANGSPRWRASLEARVLLPPVFFGADVVVFPHRVAALAAYSRAKGQPSFRLPLPDSQDWVDEPALVLGDTLVVVTRKGEVAAFGEAPAEAPPAPR